MNCLVIKLKESIENDKLPIFNGIVIRGINTAKIYSRENGGNTDIIWEIVGDGHFENSSGDNLGKVINQSQFPTSSQSITIQSNSDVILRVKNVKELKELSITNYTTRSEVKIDGLEYLNVKIFSLKSGNYGKSTYFDISELQYSTDIETVDLSYLTKIKGDITEIFGDKTKLTFFESHVSGLSGTLESFVHAQRSNGRTSGTISNSEGNNWGACTINGQLATGALSWTADSITCGNVTVQG